MPGYRLVFEDDLGELVFNEEEIIILKDDGDQNCWSDKIRNTCCRLSKCADGVIK